MSLTQRLRAAAKALLTPAPAIASEHSLAQSPVIASEAKQSASILDSYVKSAPSAQNALDIFAGEWSSRLPPPYDQARAGGALLFDDARVAWMQQQLGDLSGLSALDLGPLEGGHDYMLEKYGVKEVLAIEANTRAYLRCLIVKELLGLQRTQFLCGDFIEYLRQNERSFDLIIASGVLYHMPNPLELLGLLGQRSARHVYLWTHYYDAALLKPHVRAHIRQPLTLEYAGFQTEVHYYAYQDTLDVSGFCGGSNPYSCWMTRPGILAALESYGFRKIAIGADQPDHPHGPAFAVVASK